MSDVEDRRRGGAFDLPRPRLLPILFLAACFLALHELAVGGERAAVLVLLGVALVFCLAKGVRDRHWLFAGTVFFLLAQSVLPWGQRGLGEPFRWTCPAVWCLLELPRVLRGSPAYRPITGVHRLGALFVGLALLSATWSIDPLLTVLRAVSIGLGYVFLCFCLWRHVADASRVRRMVESVLNVHLAGVVAGLGLASWDAARALRVYAFAERGAESSLRFHGVYLNPNDVGVSMLLVLPWLLTSVGAARGLRARNWVPALLAGGTLLAAGTRSVALAIVVALLTRGGRRAKIFGLATLLLAGSYLVLREAVLDTLGSTLIRSRTVVSLGERWDVWTAVLPRILDRAALGHGYGTGDRLVRHYGISSTENILQQAAQGPSFELHSTFLQLFADLGLFGIAFGAALLVWTVRLTLRAPARAPPGWERVVRPLEVAITAGMIVAMFESFLFAFGGPCSLVFWSYGILLMRARLAPLAPAQEPAEPQAEREPSPALSAP